MHKLSWAQNHDILVLSAPSLTPNLSEPWYFIFIYIMMLVMIILLSSQDSFTT